MKKIYYHVVMLEDFPGAARTNVQALINEPWAILGGLNSSSGDLVRFTTYANGRANPAKFGPYILPPVTLGAGQEFGGSLGSGTEKVFLAFHQDIFAIVVATYSTHPPTGARYVTSS